MKFRQNSVSHVGYLLFEHVHLLGIAGAGREREEDFITSLRLIVSEVGHPVTSDASCKVHVLLLHSDSLGVDSAEVCVLEKTNDVGF